jgi:hypothetical protein
MKLPLFLKKYFWDVDFSSLDFEHNPDFVIARILEYGDMKAVRWMRKSVDEKKIKKIVEESRQLSRKSANFWSLFFNISREKIRCFKKSYQKMQKSHWPY